VHLEPSFDLADVAVARELVRRARLLEQARRRKLPIVIVNRGPTKGDRIAARKIDAGTSETLAALRSRLLG
jgi:hypothetical protein